jgi:aspartyl-tRNA synthetase
MLKALGSGTPPHGGIAWGLDRMIMLLENEPNIREVIAFAKNGEGKDLMMNSPAEVSKEQLKESEHTLEDLDHKIKIKLLGLNKSVFNKSISIKKLAEKDCLI